MTVNDLLKYLEEQNPDAEIVFFTDDRAYWLRDIEPDHDNAEQPLVILHLDTASDAEPEEEAQSADELREAAKAEAEHYEELLRLWRH